MAAPDAAVVRSTYGYHPVTTDLDAVIRAGSFRQLLIFGPGVSDVVDLVDETRMVSAPPVQLPQGIYWFSGVDPSVVLSVTSGASPGASAAIPPEEVEDGSALDNALGWIDASWDGAPVVAKPRFAVGEDVLVDGTGQDGVVRPGRRYVSGSWLYNVFAGGQTVRRNEDSLSLRPTIDDASAWVSRRPDPPKRFAATLTRAKLEGHFTDTMFSFRATRTLFRPYQFKPVQKLLDTGTLRLLIADEVGLGKTIEAGLVWTEMEARRQADRVLVVCPSSLVQKWKREMEDRFGFLLVELDNPGLADLLERLETDRLPRRAAYISSIERLRVWDGIERATELGLQFDLSIVDEAHAFRNSDTRSYELGEQIQDWSDALVMLSATPVNLRNRDLFNLLSLLVPGEFEDVESLERRIAPNAVLNKLTKSLADPRITNADRRAWLTELEQDVFGFILTLRPDYQVLRETLATDFLDAAGAVAVKRLCAELHGLSAQVTRTRKIDVQEDKPLREPRRIDVNFDGAEARFYDAYFQWCVERAALSGTPLNFSMQMPLRLAGSCLPEAARYVLEWGHGDDVESEESAEVPPAKKADLAPGPALLKAARGLSGDTKYDQLVTAVADLVAQDKQVILFTFSRRTLRYLEQRLGRDFRIGVLHGGVPKNRRERIMSNFRRGEFDLLLASKVASEGLDFEFCSAVVNYDLPWNPMEVEQRIGRIDRIGQIEKKIGVLNFHTPGTIETDIIERVMERIEVFEHSIGELEPILESEWRSVEKLLFDFTLTPDQRRLRTDQAIQAIEMQAKDREFIESAAPMLVSSDGAEIDGLERDLLASGRYVGQEELALLVEDWAETYGGTTHRDGSVLRLRGNEELADHVQALIRTGERRAAEVQDLCAQLRSEQDIVVSLDQEFSRTSDVPLLTATHPLTRAAVGTPGHRHGRFTLLRMTPESAGVAEGIYLALLAVVHWNGVRPIHEVWSSSIDLSNLSDAGDPLGSAIMKELATASYKAGPLRDHPHLIEAVDLATMNLEARVATRRTELIQENDAFIATRRASFTEVHERRMRVINSRLQTHIERGQTKMMPLAEGKLRKEQARYDAQVASLESAAAPSLTTDDLATCVVEVIG
ncbi:superfamily II DNA or RNA helicase [Nocardioides thalensis]|uniref:Superfamily II DNA or RNA helicase n=1 Tax=Nocardioides thalensis TaxID=1914755 RepID=A0A853C3X7_9ACTN|nr:helicase-related protein [Nocardioides thalensis]NYJ02425.1 superfamily II DNA or RNA helicase [Nocardioides thalensis]